MPDDAHSIDIKITSRGCELAYGGDVIFETDTVQGSIARVKELFRSIGRAARVDANYDEAQFSIRRRCQGLLAAIRLEKVVGYNGGQRTCVLRVYYRVAFFRAKVARPV